MTRVFLLHASGDPDWPEAELNALAGELEAQGFEVLIDTHAPAEVLHGGGDLDWIEWMLKSLEHSDHWVILDSTEYARRSAREPGAHGQGRGVAFEYRHLQLRLYDEANLGRIFQLAKGRPTNLRGLDGMVRRLQAPDQTLQLIEALVALRQSSHAQARAAQTAAEHSYLRHWLDGELADHPARVIPLAGEQQTVSPLLRFSQLPFNHDLLLEQTDVRGQTHRQTFGDARAALNAARPQQPLMVLGEPGAGKSWTLDCRFIDLADACLADPLAPLPLLLRLGDWLDEKQTLDDFIEAHWQAKLGQAAAEHLTHARSQRRVFLLLDALNEIPSEQREAKAAQVVVALRQLGPKGVWAGAVLSCRERDAVGPLNIPCDRLTLQPLRPPQVLDFLRRWHSLLAGSEGLSSTVAEAQARAHFWQLAAGADDWQAAQALCDKWAGLGVPFEQFWALPKIPKENPRLVSRTSASEFDLWRRLRSPRSLVHLAANPFWLTLLAAYLGEFGALPRTRPQLIDRFLTVAHDSAFKKLKGSQDKARAPGLDAWKTALTELADALQGGPLPSGEEAESATRLPRDRWPASLPSVLEFSVGAQVLREHSGLLSFSHQLLQEALAAQRLLGAWASGARAQGFWPRERWWLPNGWDVAAELALESLQNQPEQASDFLGWLAQAQPDWASAVSQRLAPNTDTIDSPAVAFLPPPASLVWSVAKQWPLSLLVGPDVLPDAAERAALGRAWGRLGLDTRPGVGLRPDGLPDLQWVVFDEDDQPFVYQGQPHPPLPRFSLARYPITNAQYAAFVADGGYADDRWWQDLAQRPPHRPPHWSEANGPRESVSWYEAVAYCRWLSHRLDLPEGQVCRLPAEQEWERAAAGLEGRPYPWDGADFGVGRSNCDESGLSEGHYLARTSAVGLYPASPEGLFDLAGNVWEWCLNQYDTPTRFGVSGEKGRVLRGGSWDYAPRSLRASGRDRDRPGSRDFNLGFRVCLSAPI